MTSFIGREREIAEIGNLLDPVNGKTRLATLTGSGGCSKTRLSLEVARETAEAFHDGVWFIELASILDPSLVPQAVSLTLGIQEARGDSPATTLTKFLSAKHTLLIFDNCEQVISAIASLAEEVLGTCPHVRILATSREILNVPGEVLFRVPPLSLPEGDSVNNELISQSESVRLFVERAQAVLPSFILNEDNISSVIQICRHLEGMPLAIELAAARASTLPVQQIAARLVESLQILTEGRRTLPRHQTLRATIQWSYDLLSESEQALLQRLSIFSGGWTLEVAEKIAGDSSLILAESILNLLSQLVNKSLVIVEWKPKGDARYAMLQTIREFAREKLRAAGETEDMRARHFDYFLLTAQQGEPRLFAENSSLDWAEREVDNLRAALAWTLEKDATGNTSDERARLGLELMASVWPLWLYRGYLTEGRELLKQLLAAHTSPTLARSRALLLRADFARADGDYTGQTAFIQESLSLARMLGDKKRIAWALMELGAIELDHGRYAEAIPLQIESLQLFQALKEDLWVSRLCFFLSETHIANGSLESAKPYLLQGLDIARALNDKWHTGIGLEGLGNLERLAGRFQQAREFYIESLNLRVEVMDRVGISYLFKAFAQLNATQGQFDRAARLWGAAEKLQQSLGFLPTPLREQFHTTLIPTAREHLGEKSFTEAWEKGKAMKMEEAIEYALTLPVE